MSFVNLQICHSLKIYYNDVANVPRKELRVTYRSDLRHKVPCVCRCAGSAFRRDDDVFRSAILGRADPEPCCRSQTAPIKLLRETVSTAVDEIFMRRRQSDVYLCGVADLNNVSSSARFRQSTHNHVRVSNSLHLITRTYMRPIKWMFLAIQLRRKLRSELQITNHICNSTFSADYDALPHRVGAQCIDDPCLSVCLSRA